MRPRIFMPSSRRVSHVTDIPLNRFFLHMAPVYIYFIYFVLFFMRTFNQNQNQKARWEGRGWKKNKLPFWRRLLKMPKSQKELKQKNESRNARVKNIYEKN